MRSASASLRHWVREGRGQCYSAWVCTGPGATHTWAALLIRAPDNLLSTCPDAGSHHVQTPSPQGVDICGLRGLHWAWGSLVCEHLTSVLEILMKLSREAQTPVSEAPLQGGAFRCELGPQAWVLLGSRSLGAIQELPSPSAWKDVDAL